MKILLIITLALLTACTPNLETGDRVIDLITGNHGTVKETGQSNKTAVIKFDNGTWSVSHKNYGDNNSDTSIHFVSTSRQADEASW